jgi:hypothetical protein
MHLRSSFLGVTVALLLPVAGVRAEPAASGAIDSQHHGFSLGTDVLRMQDDFALGVRVSSPSLFQDSIRLTLAGGVAWFPHDQNASGNEQWRTYGHARFVVEAGHRIEGTPIRLYGFGGVLLLALPDSLSSNSIAPGGLGGFGFEFYMPRGGNDGPLSYFLELGGLGTGAKANHAPGHPSIGSGFLVAAGLRWYP